MNMQEQHLRIEKTARYFTSGELNSGTREVWFLLHGFGMQAASFLNLFDSFTRPDRFLIAPEALNKFYLNGFSGKTGATWMTKEDRLNEIKDYVNYLDSLYLSMNMQGIAGLKIHALGFSQGASTVSRWAAETRHHLDKVIFYAGEIAPELLPPVQDSGLLRTKNYLIYGSKDEFIKPELFDAQIERCTELHLNLIPFEGGHEIITELLEKVSD